MINVVEAFTEIVKNFTDEEPKPPLHVGEVMALWTAFTAFEEAHSLYQIGLNTTNDPDLITLLEDALKGSNQDSIKIQDLLVKEGVPLPLSNANKPKSNPMSVPNGVRLTDDEIANLISVKVAASISFCAQSMSQSIRSDVGLLFISIQINLMEYAATLKNVLKRRGWLRIPPPYIPPGTPYSD